MSCLQWLKSSEVIPILLSFLSPEYPASIQTAAGDFLKAIITISANATQNDQSCIGPNSLTRQLVSAECIETLISDMLQGGNPLTVGVGIVIEVIRKNNSDYDPENIGGPDSSPTTYDPIYLGTLLRLFADRIPDFMDLIRSPKHNVIQNGKVHRVERGQLNSAWGAKIEPLGFDRFKTCELMAELLHCSNMSLLNESGSDDYVRQRDAERERLIAAVNSQRDASFENSDTNEAPGSGLAAESNPSKNSKEAEVTNPNDAVSFEDVNSSAVLVEGEKDSKESKGGNEETQIVEPSALASKASEASAEPEQSTEQKQDGNDKEKTAGKETATETHGLDDALRRTNLDDPEAAPPVAPKQGADLPLLSPHAEDVPAPLKQTTLSTPENSAPTEEARSTAEQTSEEKPSTEADTVAPIDELARQCIQPDVNGRPVVGDYLKIMFVDYKVVPSILVSNLYPTCTSLLLIGHRTSFSVSRGTTFCTMSSMTSFSKSSMGRWNAGTTEYWL